MATSHSTRLFALVIPVLAIFCGWVGVHELVAVDEPRETAEAPWVRTASGWERADWLIEQEPLYEPPVHPAPVAMGMLLLASLLCLAAGSGETAHRSSPPELTILPEDRL